MLMIRLYCSGLTIATARIRDAKARFTSVAEGIHANKTGRSEFYCSFYNYCNRSLI